MAEIIIMPKLGFNMDEGKLVEWYKNVGDSVKKGEPLFSVETDKTNMDIESTRDGVVKAELINAGDKIPVTLPIAVIGDANEDCAADIAQAKKDLAAGGVATAAAEEAPQAAPAAPAPAAPAPQAVPQKADGNLKITPRARRVAAENGLDITGLAIAGTGWDGGICEKDILEYLANNKVKASPLAQAIAAKEGVDLAGVQGTGFGGKVMKNDVLGALKPAPAAASEEAPQADVQYSPDGKEIRQVVPYSGIRKVIGDRMCESKFQAPHVYFTQEVDVSKVLEIRKQVNAAQEKKTSVTDFIARAVVIALEKYPEMNASLQGDKIIQYKSVNLGIAVAAPSGLIVPNVKDAQKLSVVELSKQSGALVEKARAGKLALNEYTGGTFTISNLGMFGIDNFTAIINAPEVGILAVAATKDRPVVIVNEQGVKEIAIRPIMKIQLTADHRLVDGLLASQFVTEVKNLLENPVSLLL